MFKKKYLQENQQALMHRRYVCLLQTKYMVAYLHFPNSRTSPLFFPLIFTFAYEDQFS